MTDGELDPSAVVVVTIGPGVILAETMAQIWLEQARRSGYPQARLTHKVTVGGIDAAGHMYVARAILKTGPRIVVCRFGDNTEPKSRDTGIVGGTTRAIDITGMSPPQFPGADRPTRELRARRPPIVFDRDLFDKNEDEADLSKLFARL